MLVLGYQGYETAVKGKSGFVCFVERSWAAGFDDLDFWNPKLRAPNCFNGPAADRAATVSQAYRLACTFVAEETSDVMAGVGYVSPLTP